MPQMLKRVEAGALLWVLALQVLQIWIMTRGLPSDPDFLVLPLGGFLAIQAWGAELPYLAPWLCVPLYAVVLAGLAFLAFRMKPGRRLRYWLCGFTYYLAFLLTWPLFMGVGCPTCIG